MDRMPITKHAKRRFRQRLKLPARALKRMAGQAWEHGQRVHELPKAARLKVLSQQSRFDPDGVAEPVIYRGFIFIFDRETRAFVTVYPLSVPDEFMAED